MNRRGLLGMLAATPALGALFLKAEAKPSVPEVAEAYLRDVAKANRGPTFVLDDGFKPLLLGGVVRLAEVTALTWRMLEPYSHKQRWLGKPVVTRVHWEPDRLTLMVDDSAVFVNDEDDESIQYRVDQVIATIDDKLLVGALRTDLVITHGNTLTLDFGQKGLFTMENT